MTNILVIDDDPEITSMLEAVLSSDIHHVQTTNSGREGLRLLRENPFDVVITDIIMPWVDGFEIIMEINRMHQPPRVIAMTGGTATLSQEYLSIVANGLSAQQVLLKPFTMDQLKASVFPSGEGGEKSGGLAAHH